MSPAPCGCLAPYFLLDRVPAWLQGELAKLGHHHAVFGGAVRDALRGSPYRDLDLISLASTRALLEAMLSTGRPLSARVPRRCGGTGENVPIAEARIESDVCPITIVGDGFDLWSAREYGWDRPPTGPVRPVGFTCNGLAVWSDCTFSHDRMSLQDIADGLARPLPGIRDQQRRSARMAEIGLTVLELDHADR